MTDDQDLQTLYRELILDHSRKPRNFCKLSTATHQADGINPLCGDKLHIYLEADDEAVDRCCFEGSGCAISLASASMLTELVAGLDRKSVDAYIDEIMDRLTQSDDPGPMTDGPLQALAALDGVRAYPTRVKCATLAWQALRAALDNSTRPATTE